MVRQRAAGRLGRQRRGVDEARKDDGTRALDVVVEERVAVPEAREVRERLVRREVFELHEQLREVRAQLVHELVHECVRVGLWDALLPEAEVERVVEELLGVRAEVDADWHGGLGADAVVGGRSQALGIGQAEMGGSTYPAPAT